MAKAGRKKSAQARAKGSRASTANSTGRKAGKAELRAGVVPHAPKQTRSEFKAQFQGSRDKTFPIVGIGASAGGLEAFTHLLGALPADTGMGFVLVQHLAPTHESILTEILSRTTGMPVSEVEDGMLVLPDHVYVIPPNTNMAVLHRRLNLMPRIESGGKYMPIDYFLRSLSEDQAGRAIGVILSGTASDGALGLAAIKAEGGITFAQDPVTAKYDGMPRSAIAAGAVDLVLPPEGIARELARISSHPYVAPEYVEKGEVLLPEGEDALNKIFILLRSACGVDFTHYKHTTIKRRIIRRMVLHKIEGVNNYIKFLQRKPAEVELLYQDILITVTNFFRDPDAYEAVKAKVFPFLVKNRQPHSPVRMWIPGCSTGEEAYSIAICWMEFMNESSASVPIQIFATDISEEAIGKARAGVYPESIVADVSPERLARYFIKSDGRYQINKSIRDMFVFARHDLTKDPPFSKLDFISCRNVLIYLGPVLQKKVIPIFHYALNPWGFLMLGNSETIGLFADIFALVDKKYKIYAQKASLTPVAVEFAVRHHHTEKEEITKPAKRLRPASLSGINLQREADMLVLNKYAPASMTINENLDILQFRGHTSPYLEPMPGSATLNLLKMVRKPLLHEVRTAVQEATKKDASVRRENLRVRFNGQTKVVNLEVMPIRSHVSKERVFLILFEDSGRWLSPGPNPAEPGRAKAGKRKAELEAVDREIALLTQELEATQTYLQAAIEEQEATNEELRSANEEIQSSNEELQSTNEELETAKEELQSANEELTTVNDELQNRHIELSQLNNDLNNLLGGVNTPIVMLGHDLRIRRFTEPAQKILNLFLTDIGRPIGEISHNIELPDLQRLVSEVVDTLDTVEREVQDRQGQWYSMRIRPYRTIDNKIDGAVMALSDISALKSKEIQSQEFHDFIEAVLHAAPPLLALDARFHVKRASQSFFQTFHLKAEETIGRSIYDLGDGQWNIAQLRTLLSGLNAENTRARNFEIVHDFGHIGQRRLLIDACLVTGDDSPAPVIVLSIQDLTENKKLSSQSG